MENVEGLAECVKLMRIAKVGRKDGKLLEGMACVNGCIGGPGTLVSPASARRQLKKFSEASPYHSPADNEHLKD